MAIFFSNAHFIISLTFFLSLELSTAKNIVIGGVAEWTNFLDSSSSPPDYSAWAASNAVHVGDSLIFKYKPLQQNVYIFHDKRAFDFCNFSQASVLDQGKSGSFTWLPSRPGFFYFSCNKSVEGAITHCEAGQKVAIRVYPKAPERPASSPEISPEMSPSFAPSPSSGGSSPLSPLYRWPFFSPASTPSLSPVSSPNAFPATPVFPNSGAGIPFISSSPAVALPRGETDAATIQPLPTSDVGSQVWGRRKLGLCLHVLLLLLLMLDSV